MKNAPKCSECDFYVLNAEKPRISRCRHRMMFIDSDIKLMATEGRLPNNACGPEGRLFVPRKKRGERDAVRHSKMVQ